MSKLIVANLKSSLDDFNVKNYVKNIEKVNYDNLVICPQYKYLNLFDSSTYMVGLQDINDETVLNNTKAKYVILGHYDKRINNETDELINIKVKQCISKGLNIILCVGNNETDDYNYILNQIKVCIKDIDKSNLKNIIIAYEPFYMIGNDKKVDIDLIKEYIKHIKDYIKSNYNIDIKVLYGGNVNESNIDEIFNVSDGILVGRLSFDVNRFTQILYKF